jgi:hypothetical protein
MKRLAGIAFAFALAGCAGVDMRASPQRGWAPA